MAIRSKWRLLGPDPKFITLLLKAASFFLGWTEGNCMVQFPVKCKVSINRPFWRFSRIKLHQPAWLMANLKVSEKEHVTVIWQVVQKIKWLTAASLCWKVALYSVRESWFLGGPFHSQQESSILHTCSRKATYGNSSSFRSCLHGGSGWLNRRMCVLSVKRMCETSWQSWGLPRAPISSCFRSKRIMLSKLKACVVTVSILYTKLNCWYSQVNVLHSQYLKLLNAIVYIIAFRAFFLWVVVVRMCDFFPYILLIALASVSYF